MKPSIAHRIDTGHESRSSDATTAQDVQFRTTVLVPVLNRSTMKFELPADCEQRVAESVECESLELDSVLVCPDCACVPTIRSGCGQCGCGVLQKEPLIHHFACAFVGAAADFRQGDDLVCPKCCVNGLVSGTDFEQSDTRFTCCDCSASFADPQLIGHCLVCENRFPLQRATEQTLTGYRLVEVERKASRAVRRQPVRAPRLNRKRPRGRKASRSHHGRARELS